MDRRNAIVTGASRGIGVHLARALAERQLDLLLVARSAPELERLAEELRGPDRRIAVAAIDLSQPGAATRIAAIAEAELGGVDVLVNNAAVELQRRFHALELDEIEHVLRVDLTAPLELARVLLPGMLE